MQFQLYSTTFTQRSLVSNLAELVLWVLEPLNFFRKLRYKYLVIILTFSPTQNRTRNQAAVAFATTALPRQSKCCVIGLYFIENQK